MVIPASNLVVFMFVDILGAQNEILGGTLARMRVQNFGEYIGEPSV